eukprot:4091710-Prymnesium_polylepis.1
MQKRPQDATSGLPLRSSEVRLSSRWSAAARGEGYGEGRGGKGSTRELATEKGSGRLDRVVRERRGGRRGEKARAAEQRRRAEGVQPDRGELELLERQTHVGHRRHDREHLRPERVAAQVE